MPSEVIILSSNGPDSADLNFVKLSQFLGVKSVAYDLQGNMGQINHLKQYAITQDSCMVMSGNTLAKLFSNHNHRDRLKTLFFQNASCMLIYDLSPSDSHNFAIQQLTDNEIASLSNFDNCNYSYEISSDTKPITREFSGAVFGPINNMTDFNLSFRTNSRHILTLISINNQPFFVMLRNNNCDLFIIASKGIIDVDKTASKTSSIKQYFSQIVPHLMFLKHAFQDMCWHNSHTSATFIIDDPLLKERYGFLEYRKLLQVMDKYNFSSSIAFIPWNFNRTADSVAKLFRQRGDRLSLCVHGCDHTKAEFGETDEHKLNQKVRLATERMVAHKLTTGIDFHKVMVFPQGIFSTTSMKILKANNYLAAVNSTPYVSTELSNGLKISDYLDVAVMTHENFPLFVRRYPEDPTDFAFDAFFGKPILIVQHQDYFRDGYENVIKFVKAINSISNDIRWTGLGEIVRTSYLEKEGSDGNVYCKMYSNDVLIKNRYDYDKTYVVFKPEMNNVPLKEVLVNGKNWPYQLADDILSLAVEIRGHAVADVKIVYEEVDVSKVETAPLSEALKVTIRRLLSEFRDNYICRNPSLLRLGEKAARFILSKGRRE